MPLLQFSRRSTAKIHAVPTSLRGAPDGNPALLERTDLCLNKGPVTGVII